MDVIRRHRVARLDLVDIFAHYTREAGIAVARRFLKEVEATFAVLAGLPGMGTRYAPDNPVLADVRYLPVNRFRRYIIFYRPIPSGIEVLRVVHGARDLVGLLGEDLGIGDDLAEEDDPE